MSPMPPTPTLWPTTAPTRSPASLPQLGNEAQTSGSGRPLQTFSGAMDSGSGSGESDAAGDVVGSDVGVVEEEPADGAPDR